MRIGVGLRSLCGRLSTPLHHRHACAVNGVRTRMVRRRHQWTDHCRPHAGADAGFGSDVTLWGPRHSDGALLSIDEVVSHGRRHERSATKLMSRSRRACLSWSLEDGSCKTPFAVPAAARRPRQCASVNGFRHGSRWPSSRTAETSASSSDRGAARCPLPAASSVLNRRACA